MTFTRLIQSGLSLRPLGALAATLVLAGCGGGGGEGAFSVGSNALAVTSTAITEASSPGDTDSQFESADPVDWVIPLSGGCGGPYVVKVVAGSLPPGISALGGVEGATKLHHLRGTLLQHGNYAFTLEITDTACVPFEFTTAQFAWNIEQGSITIVTAEPTLYPPGTYDIGFGVKNPLYDALPDTVFGSSTVVEIVIAGGTPPYTLDVVNDPNNADDEDGLPPGISIPPFSRSLVGAPLSLIDGEPYIFSLVATDANGQKTAPKTLQWEITAPPILFLDNSFLDGKCGEPYFMGLQIKDGVPPFNFRLVQSDVDRDGNGDPAVIYQSPNQPIISPASCQALQGANYPAPNDLGPDYRSFLVPPEGLRFGNDGGNLYAASGALAGIPRRRGQFGFHVYCFSTTAPTASGQHNWKYFEMTSEVSEPPNLPLPPFGQNPAYTLTGAFSPVQPYAPIADAEVGVAVYNPDAGYHSAPGLLLRAQGGVRKDGLTDAPNATQVASIDGLGIGQEDGTTPNGGYDWTVNPNPIGDGDTYTTLPAGMALDSWIGVWRVADANLLKGQQYQALEFTCVDQQLPTQLRNQQSQRVRFAVGPDKVIITESTLSGTSTTSTTNRGDMHDYLMTVKVCMPYSGNPAVVRPLELGDLSPTHTVPSTTGLSGTGALASLLTNQDIMRVCVSPVGWWDDMHSLNNLGARSGMHGDHNDASYYPYSEYFSSASGNYSRQPSATAVEIPAYRPGVFNAVSHDPDNGIYTNGGRLYPFANGSHFGVFMIRSDATLYVPFAIGTSQSVDGQTFNGFGDHQLVTLPASGMVHSSSRAINMAVSPDGRFAAVKIMNNATNFPETANLSRIVIFSLTGEKLFGGQTWTIVQTGSVGNSTTGTYLYGSSIVMTNSHLYYLCGRRYGTSTTATPSREHFIYRFQFAHPATGAGVAGGTGTGAFLAKADAGETSWTNTTNAPMQTRFHLWFTSWSGSVTYASAMSQAGQNVTENGMAPLPFRVSHDGRAIAILAMPDVGAVSSSVDSQAWHVWVDFQGNGVRRLSSAARHVTGGGTRPYMLSRGANTNTYENWSYSGPTSQLEISDDGTKVAVVVNRYSGSFTTTESSPTVWYNAREDVIAYRTTDWSTWTELPVTGDNAGTNIFSAASGMLWRFGALTFTKDHKGLVFWGGNSQMYGATATSSYHYGVCQAGTMYGSDISSATSITGLTVTSLLATSNGGSGAGVANYTTSSPYNPTPPYAATWDGTTGVIKPMGGFVSRNREFLYIMNKGGLQNNGTDHQLIGINIRSTNTAQNINGRTDFRGFGFSNWPARRGFIGHTYTYYPYYGMYIDYYSPGRKHGFGRQVMPANNGWVFFTSHWQAAGPYNYLYVTISGGPTYTTFYGDYGGYGGEVEAFNADVGGEVVRLSNFNSDSSARRIHFLTPTAAGDALAYVLDTYSVYYSSPSTEQLHAIRGISLQSSNGALIGTPQRVAIESAAGRVSEAVSFGSSTDRVYYAQGSSTNENGMILKEASISSAGVVTVRNLTSVARRYNVLFAQR